MKNNKASHGCSQCQALQFKFMLGQSKNVNNLPMNIKPENQKKPKVHLWKKPELATVMNTTISKIVLATRNNKQDKSKENYLNWFAIYQNQVQYANIYYFTKHIISH